MLVTTRRHCHTAWSSSKKIVTSCCHLKTKFEIKQLYSNCLFNYFPPTVWPTDCLSSLSPNCEMIFIFKKTSKVKMNCSLAEIIRQILSFAQVLKVVRRNNCNPTAMDLKELVVGHIIGRKCNLLLGSLISLHKLLFLQRLPDNITFQPS